MRKLLALLGGLLLFYSSLLAQNRTITGCTYSITIPPSAKVLVLSSMGMSPVEMNIGNKGIINTSMQSLDKEMQEVVVTVPNGVLNAPPVFRIRGTNSISPSSYQLVAPPAPLSYSAQTFVQPGFEGQPG